MTTLVDRRGWPVRKLRLGEEPREDRSIAAMTPSERLGLVWPLTLNAWAFKEGRLDEPRLRRDAVRTLRLRR
ncbi:MAG TPA: hypothetical protein PK598_08385 [Thermoanaerobaculia bacterium]|nr:hypothetical protein [Thermoanaerobaculia bacterium]